MSKDNNWMDVYLARVTGSEKKKETRSELLRSVTTQQLVTGEKISLFEKHAKDCKNGCKSNDPKLYCGIGRQATQLVELATQGKIVTKF